MRIKTNALPRNYKYNIDYTDRSSLLQVILISHLIPNAHMSKRIESWEKFLSSKHKSSIQPKDKRPTVFSRYRL